MNDRVAKQRLNVILLVDCSTSMRGERISQVNSALHEIQKSLVDIQNENANVDFYITTITFSTEARFLNGDNMKNIAEFAFKDIQAGGWSNLHLAYEKLNQILTKESKGGIMPDFGGLAPIIMVLSDGHPTGEEHKAQLELLKQKPWFNVALRYGVAIELNDQRTKDVLKDFVGDSGEVIDCFDAKKLKQIIKVVVVTASKVKSQSANVQANHNGSVSSAAPNVGQNSEVQQEIMKALTEADEWEW